MLRIVDGLAEQSMSLSSRDEDVPIALLRKGAGVEELFYHSLIEEKVGLLEIGIRASDGLLMSVTAVNVPKAYVTDVGQSRAFTTPTGSAARLAAPRADISQWRSISCFEDRFITETASVRYSCYRDAIAIEWATAGASGLAPMQDGQVTWLLDRDGYLVGLVIGSIESGVVEAFKTSLV
jgi:hypothetical protein